jgi:hypothetical protein
MKMNLKFIKIVTLLTAVVLIQACGGDGYNSPTPTPTKTPQQLATEALTEAGTLTWTLAGTNSVTRDGTNVTDLYKNFELVLNSGSFRTYTSISNNDLLDNSGNWSFAGTNFDKFTLAGTKPAAGREISFTRTGDNLRLTFNIPVPGARTNGIFAVAGNYVFNLNKK